MIGPVVVVDSGLAQRRKAYNNALFCFMPVYSRGVYPPPLPRKSSDETGKLHYGLGRCPGAYLVSS